MIHKPRKPRNDNLVMANFLQRPHQWSIGGKRRGLFWQAYLHAKGRYEYKSGHFLTDVDLPVSPWCRHRSARAAQRCAQLAAPVSARCCPTDPSKPRGVDGHPPHAEAPHMPPRWWLCGASPIPERRRHERSR